MAWTFRPIGGGADPFAPKQRTLPSEDILRVLSWDPNDHMDHGRFRAIRHRLESVRGIQSSTQEQRLVEWALQVEPKEPKPDTFYVNPARLPEGKRSQRTLSLGELEFVRQFEGAKPESVSPEDVKLLAELELEAESEPERRVVARVVGPIRRHHDRKEEEQRLRNTIARHTPSGYRCPQVREAWQPVLAERLFEESRAEIEPQLAGLPADVREKTLRTLERDAQREAQERIQRLWADLDAKGKREVRAARERLSALALGADPETSATRTAVDSSIEEGRRRGIEHREAREAKADAFAGFRRVG